MHEMLPGNFDFFLDEMIKQRNRMIIAELEAKGKIPIWYERAWFDAPEQRLL